MVTVNYSKEEARAVVQMLESDSGVVEDESHPMYGVANDALEKTRVALHAQTDADGGPD